MTTFMIELCCFERDRKQMCLNDDQEVNKVLLYLNYGTTFSTSTNDNSEKRFELLADKTLYGLCDDVVNAFELMTPDF